MREFASEVHDHHAPVNVFTVNTSDMSAEQLETLGIEGFPSIKLYETGKQPIEFVPEKEITKDDLSHFLKTNGVLW